MLSMFILSCSDNPKNTNALPTKAIDSIIRGVLEFEDTSKLFRNPDGKVIISEKLIQIEK